MGALDLDIVYYSMAFRGEHLQVTTWIREYLLRCSVSGYLNDRNLQAISSNWVCTS